MVKGIGKFREYFKDYTGQYVLIGGAACDISFENNNVDFRVTKDLDVVLIVEALSREFGDKFWQFIHDGGYQNRGKSTGNAQFYRFEKPLDNSYPSMIELFSRKHQFLSPNAVLTPIHIDDSVSSLSAILLNEAYYEALLAGREVVDGFSVLSPTWLIPFKAKAWLDLKQKIQNGIHVDSRDIKKHRNDIIRIASELVLQRCILPDEVKRDMKLFVESMELSDIDVKNLGIHTVNAEEIRQLLIDTYLD